MEFVNSNFLWSIHLGEDGTKDNQGINIGYKRNVPRQRGIYGGISLL